MRRRSPSFLGLTAANIRSSRAAKASSRKAGTRCEVTLRRALRLVGFSMGLNRSDLPGAPDIVLRKHRVAIFCDGDFWHGRQLDRRLNRLGTGHNAELLVRKD